VSRYRYLRQGITLTGLGTPTFDKAIQSAQEIYAEYQRLFTEDKLEQWNPADYAGHDALDASNRYLTPKRDAPNMDSIPFQTSVDPHDILADMAKKGEYIHGIENRVYYYILDMDDNGVTMYVNTTSRNMTITQYENTVALKKQDRRYFESATSLKYKLHL
jgi:hypothetical protein